MLSSPESLSGQSFSTAGRRGTIQDARGTLLWHYLRFIRALRPKFFLMENVWGLLPIYRVKIFGSDLSHI
ncbi:MAG: DNA cytosine methyltransferase [Candidatus Aminicenantes bacterium]|nr:DNA cytosine methyltransferase [Candidatus Aminicenantes bacterium]